MKKDLKLTIIALLLENVLFFLKYSEKLTMNYFLQLYQNKKN
jgi:hypothetical protein